MGTARELEPPHDWERGQHRLFELDPPLEGYRNVVVSAAMVPVALIGAVASYAETYIFGVDIEAEEVMMDELPGSYRGGLSHESALVRAGYLDIIPIDRAPVVIDAEPLPPPTDMITRTVAVDRQAAMALLGRRLPEPRKAIES